MIVAEDINTLQTARAEMTGSVGLVPTMGALHAGHMALVEAARDDNDHVVTSIFLNPTQFGPDEDLESYPRDLEGDLHKLEAAGVDCVFTPTPEIMYPPGYQTYVTVENVTQGLEGAQRPTHFRGVTTVVTKLFNLVQPDRAYFGQKDAQQVVVLRRMVYDLNIPVDIIVNPTVREADGLAMSSRNAYLSDEERQAALVLSNALDAVSKAYNAGERDVRLLEDAMWQVVAAEPKARLDYVSVLDAHTLGAVTYADESPLLVSLAVQVGKPRLLDNRLLPEHLNDREGLTRTLGAIK